jgi:hypothetical protein
MKGEPRGLSGGIVEMTRRAFQHFA